MTKNQFVLFKDFINNINKCQKILNEKKGNKPDENQSFAWAESFYGNKRLSNDKMSISDYIYILLQYKNYESIPPYLVEMDEVYGDFDSLLDDLKAINKAYEAELGISDIDFDEYEQMQGEYALRIEDVDSSFFSRIAYKMEQGESKLYNSPQYYDMKEKLKNLHAFLKSHEREGMEVYHENFDMKAYLGMLDDLEESIDEYLSHKVIAGVKANASDKVNGAAAMKDYIAERRAEIVSKIMKDGAIERTKELTEYTGVNQKSDLVIQKLGEITNTAEMLRKLVETGDLSQSAREFANYVSSLQNNPLEALNNPEDDSYPDSVGLLLMSDVVRNELAVSGGKVTPFLKALFKDSDSVWHFIEKSKETSAAKDLVKENNLDRYLKNGYQKSTMEALQKGFVKELGFNEGATFVAKTGMINQEKEIYKEHRDARRYAVRHDLPLPNDISENALKANEDKNGFAKANANLAKFVKKMNQADNNPKMLTKKEIMAKSKRYEQYNKLAIENSQNGKGQECFDSYNKLAEEQFVNQKVNITVGDTESFRDITAGYKDNMKWRLEWFDDPNNHHETGEASLLVDKKCFAEYATSRLLLREANQLSKQLYNDKNLGKLDAITDSYDKVRDEILQSPKLDKLLKYAPRPITIDSIYDSYFKPGNIKDMKFEDEDVVYIEDDLRRSSTHEMTTEEHTQ